MSVLTVIPARMSATRLPGKPLADINGKPMIIHVMERAMAANIGPVIVACDGDAIKSVVEAFGGTAITTDPALASGTDRVYAALNLYDPKKKHASVINVQGDLPNLSPKNLSLMAANIDTPNYESEYDILTLAAPIQDASDLHNPNVVKIAMKKVATGERARGYYFSRSLIPSEAQTAYHHIGIYGFKRRILEKFVALPPSYLEVSERLEQLRAIEAGFRIDVMAVESIPQSVDTPDDLEAVRKLLG